MVLQPQAHFESVISCSILERTGAFYSTPKLCSSAQIKSSLAANKFTQIRTETLAIYEKKVKS